MTTYNLNVKVFNAEIKKYQNITVAKKIKHGQTLIDMATGAGYIGKNLIGLVQFNFDVLSSNGEIVRKDVPLHTREINGEWLG